MRRHTEVAAAPLAGAAVFVAALLADVLSKSYAVAYGDPVFNSSTRGDLARRIAAIVLAVAVTTLLAWLARWRGLGRLWGAWIGCGLLTAGVLGNGISSSIWPEGVPDFVRLGGTGVWNFADFEIGLGLVGGLCSVVATAALRYAVERAG